MKESRIDGEVIKTLIRKLEECFRTLGLHGRIILKQILSKHS
jgi:hypothetical protein